MTRRLAPLILGSLVVLAGCEKKDAGKPPPPATPKTGASTSAFEAGKAAAMQAVKDKAVASAGSTLEGLTKQLDALKQKAPAVPAADKADFDSTIKGLDTQLSTATSQLDALKAAAPDAAQKASTELQATLAKIAEALKGAAEKFGK